MNPRVGRRWIPAAVACLLLAGILTPIAVLGQAGSSGQGQLGVLITVAESSATYANATVALAATHGLSVQAAQTQLTQGDSLLAAAKADARSGNIAAGIAAAQGAMSAYTSAATAASVALTDAHLTAEVDFQAALAAVAEVNATVSIAASAAAQACGSIAVSGSNSSAFAQACTQVDAQTSAARVHLSEAASLLVQANGQAAASADVSQALSLTVLARTEAEASVSTLLMISSFSYTQRAVSYVAAVVTPLSAKANQTVAAEQSTMATLAQVQTEFATYSQGQASATADVTASASALAAAVTQVNTQAVATSITSAQMVEEQLSVQLNALLSISGIAALSNIVADISSCQAVTASYNSSLNTGASQSSAYAQTLIGSFSAYTNTMSTDAASVQSAGSVYVSAYQKLVADLNVPAILVIPGVKAIYTTLLGLQVSGSVTDVNTALQQESSAMGAVATNINSMTSVVVASSTSILVNTDLYTSALGISNQGQQFLNATGAAAVAQASTSFLTTVQDAESFVASANASVRGTIGVFATFEASLTNAAASLGSQTQASMNAQATVSAYLASDEHARSTLAASGQAEVTQALGLFSEQNVVAGVAAVSRASIDFQTASEAGF